MRLIKYAVGSSIGRKQVVALTGLLLVGFLASHLSGNLLILFGPEAFDSYAEFLAAHPLLIPAEIGLAAVFITHIVWGLWVSFQNRAARPDRYEVNENEGGRTPGSATMKYTGVMTLIYLLIHIYTMKIQHVAGTSLWNHAVNWFEIAPYTLFYLFAMVGLGLHLSHGLKSAAQTFGINHPRYTPVIEIVGFVLAVGFGVGFGILPIWSLTVGSQL
ncbi:MAG: succinate dehydrogenase [Elusimicrobia bacterium]|nr:MAG: succinate dehydrogenase [Elusimicrobiota bacterium]